MGCEALMTGDDVGGCGDGGLGLAAVTCAGAIQLAATMAAMQAPWFLKVPAG